MKYNNFRRKTITITEANKILSLLKSLKIKIILLGPNDNIKSAKLIKDFNYSKYAVVKENDSCLIIETKYYEPKYKATRYTCNLNEEKKAYISGQQVFCEFQKYCFKAVHAKTYKNQTIDKMLDPETGKYVFSAGPVIDYNQKYENQELFNVYEYDLNSAYSSIMLNGIPDVNHPKFNVKVKKGQVGFYLDNECSMTEKVGVVAEVVFDLIKLNDTQKKYIYNAYDKKLLAVDELEHNEAKLAMNAAIGYYQRFNPFIRAYIVHKCNNFILGLLDDDSVLWNTDAIFSLKRRPELELGTFIGQFKETKIKRFAYKGNNYQIDYEIPKYRGIPKAWFKDKKFDILKDELPKRCNKYLLDKTQLKLVINKEYYNG